MKWCTNCKASFDDSACYCLKCGSRLISNDEYISYMEEYERKLRESKEEDARRKAKLLEMQVNIRKIGEIRNVLGYKAIDTPYHGGFLNENNTEICNLMYDIVINKKYSGYELSNMIEEDKNYIKDKVNKIVSLADEIYRKTSYRYNKDAASLVKNALPKMMNAIFSGGRFNGYKKKDSSYMNDISLHFESHAYEVKHSISSLQYEVKRGGSNYIVEFYHAKGILYRLKIIVDSIYRAMLTSSNNPSGYCYAYQDLNPKYFDELEATYIGLEHSW